MLQLSCTQKPASHDRQNGSKRCHGKGDFGMKVAMIGHKDFPSRSGGVEVMVGGLATSLVRRGYEVTVYNRGLQKGHNVYTTEGVQARRIFTFQKASLNAMVYSFLATFDALTRDYDVIHYHAIGPSVPLVIAKLFGKHTVCTVHGLNWKVDKWGGFASAYLKLGERVAAKYADDLVVLSESEWNYFQEKYDRTAILIPLSMTYLTDNTAFYFWCTMGLRMIPLAVCCFAKPTKDPAAQKQTWQPPSAQEVQRRIRAQYREKGSSS